MACRLWTEKLEELLRKQGVPVVETSVDENGVSTILSAANLWNRALERVRDLRRAGIRRDDILCEAGDSPEVLVNLVASAMAGWVYWPVRRADISSLTTRLDPSPEGERKIHLFEAGALRSVCRPDVSLSFLPEDSVLLLQTSGTSGCPRLVAITGANLLHQIESFNQTLPGRPDAGRLILLPFHHCFGLIMDLICGLFARQTIHLRNNRMFHSEVLIRTMKENSIDCVSMVPRMVDLILIHAEKNVEARQILSRVQVHSGGAVLSEPTLDRARQVFGELVEGYGLTELSGGVMLRGRPNGCEVRLKEKPGTDCSELWVRSASLGVFAGREQWMDFEGFFNTTDLVTKRPDGTYLIRGRSSQMLKSTSGLWVQVSDVQTQLQSKFSLNLCHVENLQGVMRVYWAGHKASEKQIAHYIEKHLGLSFELVDLNAAGSVQALLQNSQKKTSAEAFREWYEVRKCG